MRVGIFAVDPGGHTGVARAIVEMEGGTTESAMRNREFSYSTTIEGSESEQIRNLHAEWMAFGFQCEKENIERRVLVFEDFVLRGGQHAGGKDGTSPERIAWGFEGYRMGLFDSDPAHRKGRYLQVVWQQPGAASRHKVRARLEAYDAWVRGREHERSAFSHMALYIAGNLK